MGGGEGRGRGQGIFHPPCHILHYHKVLCPKGTSHNQETRVFGHCIHTLISVDTGTFRLDVCLDISDEN